MTSNLIDGSSVLMNIMCDVPAYPKQAAEGPLHKRIMMTMARGRGTVRPGIAELLIGIECSRVRDSS